MGIPSHVSVRHVTGSARVIALGIVDALALLVSGLVAHLLWTVAVHEQALADYAHLAALVPFFTLSYTFGGLYPGFGVSAIQLVRTASRQTSLVFLVVVGSVYVLRLPGDYSRGALGLWWALSLVAVPLARAQLSTIAVSWSWWREPVLLIGDPSRMSALREALGQARHIGYRPIAVALIPGPAGLTGPSWEGLPLVADRDIVEAVDRLDVRTVFLSADVPAHDRWVAGLSQHVRRVVSVHPLEERYVEPVAIRYLGNAIGIEIQNRLLMRRNRLLKRAADIALGTAGMVLTFPILAVASAAIVARDRGPWWHAQIREGRDGRPFTMWKLRTMYLDADARLEAHLAADAHAREEWQREFKLTRDPRVLPVVGTFLRRWSLDECPQFLNVIRGEMSLVGPRALPLYHLEVFDPPFRALRQRVRPGMTGMWQVMSRGAGAIRRQEALDSYYIYNWSIWMDVFLLARTVLAVASGRGAR